MAMLRALRDGNENPELLFAKGRLRKNMPRIAAALKDRTPLGARIVLAQHLRKRRIDRLVRRLHDLGVDVTPLMKAGSNAVPQVQFSSARKAY